MARMDSVVVDIKVKADFSEVIGALQELAYAFRDSALAVEQAIERMKKQQLQGENHGHQKEAT